MRNHLSSRHLARLMAATPFFAAVTIRYRRAHSTSLSFNPVCPRRGKFRRSLYTIVTLTGRDQFSVEAVIRQRIDTALRHVMPTCGSPLLDVEDLRSPSRAAASRRRAKASSLMGLSQCTASRKRSPYRSQSTDLTPIRRPGRRCSAPLAGPRLIGATTA